MNLSADDDLRIESVTGVDVALPVAGAGGRSYAFVIDWHVRFLVGLAWWLAASFAYFGAIKFRPDGGFDSDGTYFLIAVLPAAALYLLYHPVLEIAMRGRTPGKRMAGVRIVTREGATPGVGALLIRNVFRLIDSLPVFYCLGLAVVMISRQHVRIGDLAAGTVLIYDHNDALPAAAGADPRMDGRLRELIEDVVGRWKELTPAARSALGNKILGRVDPGAAPVTDESGMLDRLRALLSRAA